MNLLITDNEFRKTGASSYYNFMFEKDTGFFRRWGRTFNDDPVCAPSNEILDIEISTVCHGIGHDMSSRQPCSWCYKSNTGCGRNMSLETYKQVLSKFTLGQYNERNVYLLNQIAFGIGDIDGNPDLFNIIEYTRNEGIVPNITINGMGLTPEIAERFAKLCGAVSVSHYHISDVCYNAVKMLTDAGLQQINIHQLFSKQTLKQCHKIIDDMKTDPRLAKANAVILLQLKPKGDRNTYTSATYEDFVVLQDKMITNDVRGGMDSCSAPMMMKYAQERNHEWMVEMVESCESTLFSFYVNVDGQGFPCSFCEGEEGWEEGINLLEVNNFTHGVWTSEKINEWRDKLLSNRHNFQVGNKCDSCRKCIQFDI